MQFSVLLTLVACAARVVAASTPSNSTIPRDCGTTISPSNVTTVETAFNSTAAACTQLDDVIINVHWHVVSAGLKIPLGDIPDLQIVNSMSVLNNAFQGSGVSFQLMNISRTINATWFNQVEQTSPFQLDMKKTLRLGGPSDLNIYTVGFKNTSDPGLLGYSTFPWNAASNPIDDGVVILFSTVPGGSTPNFNQGQTLTHEVGHWVGLYHTFQGGCTTSGDYVDDTPCEASPATGCPESRDSCFQPGVDPIHNFMDFTYDSCMTEFTPGQQNRLRCQVKVYRGV